MRSFRLFAAALLAAILCASTTGRAAEAPIDVVLMLDNSGSMLKNDPEFLSKVAVRHFLNELQGDVQVGVVVFDQGVKVPAPLTPLTAATRPQLLRSLDIVNFKGQFTNSPAALERSIYELKTNGRPGADKSIIFMTDGIVDTGNQALDVEKARWMREELAEEAAEAGIRIFGIAFTDNADFLLIQSLSRKSSGEYYRAYTAREIRGVFEQLTKALDRGPLVRLTPTPAPAAPAPAPAPVATLPPPSTTEPLAVKPPEPAQPALPEPVLPATTAPALPEPAASEPAPSLPPSVETETPSFGALENQEDSTAEDARPSLPPLPGAGTEPAVPVLPALPEPPAETSAPSTTAPAATGEAESAPEPEPAPAPTAEPEPAATPPAPAPEDLTTMYILIGVAAVLLVAIILVVVLIVRKKRDKPAATAAMPKAFLNDLAGVTERPSYELGNRLTIVGRLKGKDEDTTDYIVIDETTIGRRHAMLDYRDHSWWVVDQNSLNGTFVNNTRVESETRLKHGDRVRFHKFDFEFLVLDMFETDRTMISDTQFAEIAGGIEEDGDDATIARG